MHENAGTPICHPPSAGVVRPVVEGLTGRAAPCRWVARVESAVQRDRLTFVQGPRVRATEVAKIVG